MNSPRPFTPHNDRVVTDVILIRVTVILFWVAAAVSWWVSLWYVDAFAQLGVDLPTATSLVLKGSANPVVPFGIAAVFTAMISYQVFRQTHRAQFLSVWLLCVSIALSLVVMIAITLPMVKMCGEFLPERPDGEVSKQVECSL